MNLIWEYVYKFCFLIEGYNIFWNYFVHIIETLYYTSIHFGESTPVLLVEATIGFVIGILEIIWYEENLMNFLFQTKNDKKQLMYAFIMMIRISIYKSFCSYASCFFQ